MKNIILSLSVFVLLISLGSISFAQLVSLDDNYLGTVDGEGLGIVLEDFIYQAGSKEIAGGANFEIGGLQTSDNKDVVIGISQFYIAGAGSSVTDPDTGEVSYGIDVVNNPVNLGRLNNPFNFELRDGNDIDVGVSNKAVLEFSAPKLHGTTASSRPSFFVSDSDRRMAVVDGAPVITNPNFGTFTTFNDNLFLESSDSSRAAERPNMGIQFNLDIDGSRKQTLDNHIESLSVDGSFVRLWGDDGKTYANFAINVYTPRMTFFACDANGDNCGQSADFENLSIEAALGYGDKQPVTFEVNGDGNFVFEVGSPEGFKGLCGSFDGSGDCTNSTGINVLEKFYTEGPKTNIYIGNVNVGGKDFGTSTVSNLQIQYLHVQSHDL
jgi:hypothetical protein